MVKGEIRQYLRRVLEVIVSGDSFEVLLKLSILALVAAFFVLSESLSIAGEEDLRFYFLEMSYVEGGFREEYSNNVIIAGSRVGVQEVVYGILSGFCREYNMSHIRDPKALYDYLFRSLVHESNITIVYLADFEINIEEPYLVGKLCKGAWSGYFRDYSEGRLNYTVLLLVEPGSGAQGKILAKIIPVGLGVGLVLVFASIVLLGDLLRYERLGGGKDRDRGRDKLREILGAIFGFMYASFSTLMLVRFGGDNAFSHNGSFIISSIVLLVLTFLYVLYLNDRIWGGMFLEATPRRAMESESRVHYSLILAGGSLLIALFLSQYALDYLVLPAQQIDIVLTLTIVGIVLVFTAKEHHLLSRILLYYSVLIVNFLTMDTTTSIGLILKEADSLTEHHYINLNLLYNILNRLSIAAFLFLLMALLVKVFGRTESTTKGNQKDIHKRSE